MQKQRHEPITIEGIDPKYQVQAFLTESDPSIDSCQSLKIVFRVFQIDNLLKYQEGIIAALFEIAKAQGVPKDRIDGIINNIKH